MSLHKCRRYDETIDCFDKTIALDPKVPNYYANKAEMLVMLERYNEVVEHHNKALEVEGYDDPSENSK